MKMQILSSHDAEIYIDSAEVELIHSHKYASIYIGRNLKGGLFMLMMDSVGTSALIELK